MGPKSWKKNYRFSPLVQEIIPIGSPFLNLPAVVCRATAVVAVSIDLLPMYPENDPMDAIVSFVFKGAISIGIIYAWTFGFNRPSRFRGGNARNMKEEFAFYGFPDWVLPITRVVKISLAVCLLFGYFFPVLVKPVAFVLAPIMLIAVMAHLKDFRDPLVKTLPAYFILSFTIFLIFD